MLQLLLKLEKRAKEPSNKSHINAGMVRMSLQKDTLSHLLSFLS